MQEYINQFPMGTPEREQLYKAAKLLMEKSPNRWEYFVGETWFDYGQRWAWTTILCEETNGTVYQALSPRTQAAIITARNDAELEQAELVFVNESSMGLEYPDGTLRHIYIDELEALLK